MADYWTEYSFTIDNLTDAQLDWWEEKLKQLDQLEETDGYDPKDLDVDKNPLDGAEPLYWWEDYGNPGSSFVLKRKDKELWCTSYYNESGNVDGMLLVIQEYLEATDPTRIVAYECISTCNKPRTDAYGGSAIAISKDEILWESTAGLVEKLTEQLKQKL